MKGPGNAAGDRERVALVVGVFELRDHALRGADGIGKLLLGEAGSGSRVVDQLRNAIVLRNLEHLRIAFRIDASALLQNFHGVTGLGHLHWRSSSISPKHLRNARSFRARNSMIQSSTGTSSAASWKKNTSARSMQTPVS